MSGMAFTFLATLISMGTGLSGMGVECTKHEGRTPQENVGVFKFEEVGVDVV